MSWRFAWRPKWIVRHVLVAALVVTMVLLGFWQLRRWDGKKDYKHLVEARQDQPIEEAAPLLPPDASPTAAQVQDVLYRPVRATGTYAAADTFVVPNRTYNAAPGAWVLTPLVLDDGTALVVNRGFIGFQRSGEIVAPDPPTGTVTVEGLIFPSQHRGRFGAAGPGEDAPHELARADLDQIQERVGYDVRPAYIQLFTSDPPEPTPAAGAPELVPLGRPVLDEGPHLSYAVQWFLFTTIAAGGYALLLRKVALEEGKAAELPEPATGGG